MRRVEAVHSLHYNEGFGVGFFEPENGVSL
jgi:hypothetical protein